MAIIDLVLLDGDGSDLIAELRAVNPSAQALVLSANVDRSAAARAVEKGAAGVLSKIAHLHEVVGAVGRVLAGETLIPLDEVVELRRFAGRERELDERRLIETLTAREREIRPAPRRRPGWARDGGAPVHLPADAAQPPGEHPRQAERTRRLQAVIFGLRHGIVVLR